MNRVMRILTFGLLIFLATTVVGLAQGTAEISGTVRDQSGSRRNGNAIFQGSSTFSDPRW